MKHKTLSEYVHDLGPIAIRRENFSDFIVQDVANDSRKVVKDGIFVAVRGSSTDGHDYIGKAIDAGARAIFHEKEICNPDPRASFIRVRKSYAAYASICETFFGHPARSLKLVGITGTNGKTTSAYLLHSILSDSGARTGLVSTVCRITGKSKVLAERTTPESYELQQSFREMADSGFSHCVMEVSSHALDQNRIGSAKFAGVIFTNLTGDHLDYHKDMESYFSAKKILFDSHACDNSAAAVNIDDRYGWLLAGAVSNLNLLSFGKNLSARCIMRNFHLSQDSTSVELSFDEGEFILRTPLQGEYNAYNATGAFALACGLGIPPAKVLESISREINVPGRLEKVPNARGINIIVDYAHTDDALERVLSALRQVTKGRLICVFGCGGDRDRTKRPRMGAAAAKFADFIFVTSDNPRTEKPEAITREIMAGIPPAAHCREIVDRREAIRESIKLARKGDTILLAGKGHETYQEVNGVKHPFDDREEAERLSS